MAFALRDFGSIERSLLAWVAALSPELTDFTEGAVGRSLLGSLAVELQRQDLAVYQAVREAIEVGTYRTFAFTRLPAVYASGPLRVTRQNGDTPATLSAGFRVAVPGAPSRTYQTVEALSFAVGQTVGEVQIRCQTAGALGNTAANTIVETLDSLPFPMTVTNPQPLLTGLDQESDDDRRERFADFISGLSRGTRAAIQFGAESTLLKDSSGAVIERAAKALVREPFLEDEVARLGLVEVYVDNGSGTASQDLLDEVGEVLRGFTGLDGVKRPGYVSAGVELKVFGVVAVPLDVTATITLLPGFDEDVAAQAVEDALVAYLQGLRAFDAAIHAELVAAAMGVEGVADVTFTAPTANVEVVATQRIVPGVTEIEVAA